jgi:hypothetical protein
VWQAAKFVRFAITQQTSAEVLEGFFVGRCLQRRASVSQLHVADPSLEVQVSAGIQQNSVSYYSIGNFL